MTISSNDRYLRQVLIPEIGESGQQKLKASKILITGLGGLGGPAALYLAAAGIGTLGIIDSDSVDSTNLNRQVLYGESDIGLPKAEQALKKLKHLNSEIEYIGYQERLTIENAEKICSSYDIIVDGTDNRETREIINRICVDLKIPYIYASIYGFEGQVSVLAGDGNPCYRCLFPQKSEGNEHDTGPIPVLGAIPGVIGSVQAAEVIKIITGAGKTLSGRLLTVDLLTMRFTEIELIKDNECAVCAIND